MKQPTTACASDFDRTTLLTPVPDTPGEFTVEWAAPVDSSWLAMATDWFPPPAFVRLEPPTGGVSIDLTTHIRRPHVVLVAESFQTRLTTTG